MLSRIERCKRMSQTGTVGKERDRVIAALKSEREDVSRMLNEELKARPGQSSLLASALKSRIKRIDKIIKANS